jgi:hypothetical protein
LSLIENTSAPGVLGLARFEKESRWSTPLREEELFLSMPTLDLFGAVFGLSFLSLCRRDFRDEGVLEIASISFLELLRLRRFVGVKLIIFFDSFESSELVFLKDEDILARLFRDLDPAFNKAVAVESTVFWLAYFAYRYERSREKAL